MTFWKKVKRTAIVSRLVEEKIYEQVLQEIEAGVRRDGLWAKALQKSRGNKEEVKALYIGYRVQSIKDEAEITEALAKSHIDEKIESQISPTIKDEAKITEAFAESHIDKIVEPQISLIDAYDESGYTPLMRATKEMDVKAVIALIEQGANPRIRDDNFGTTTALNMAKLLLKRSKTNGAQQGIKKIIEILEPIT